MKIIMINPPIRPGDPPNYIPFGISILARIADGLGHEVGILDVNAHKLTPDGFREEIRREDYKDVDFIGVTGISGQYAFIKPIVSIIKEELPDTLLVGGGGFMTPIPETIMELLPQIDVGVIGEGERTFAELLDTTKSRKFSNVKGIIYREQETPVRTPYRPLIENLDEIPWPHWDLLPLEIYFREKAWMIGHDDSVHPHLYNRKMGIITERGCEKQCTFCTHLGQSPHDLRRIYGDPTIKGPNVRWNSPEYVVSMVEHLNSKYGVDFVYILDYSFMENKERAYKIADLWEQKGFVNTVHFSITSSIESADYELIKRLKDVGCNFISYGAETASNRLLKEVRKNTTAEQTQHAIDVTLKAGVIAFPSYMVGYPTERIEDYVKTVEFAISNRMSMSPLLLCPYPGTQLFEEHRERILAQHDGDIEKFIIALSDETCLAANISPWDDETLLKLRDLTSSQDLDGLKELMDEKQ